MSITMPNVISEAVVAKNGRHEIANQTAYSRARERSAVTYPHNGRAASRPQGTALVSTHSARTR
jgi:hypothetical protein